MITKDEIQARKECQTFDCKSIQIDPKALAIPIVAMANADGGVLAIGVSDKTRRIEGIDGNEERLNELIKNGTINDTINDTINAKVLSEALGTSVITIKRDLYVLRDMNLIRYVGSNKTGHWEVIN